MRLLLTILFTLLTVPIYNVPDDYMPDVYRVADIKLDELLNEEVVEEDIIEEEIVEVIVDENIEENFKEDIENVGVMALSSSSNHVSLTPTLLNNKRLRSNSDSGFEQYPYKVVTSSGYSVYTLTLEANVDYYFSSVSGVRAVALKNSSSTWYCYSLAHIVDISNNHVVPSSTIEIVWDASSSITVSVDDSGGSDPDDPGPINPDDPDNPDNPDDPDNPPVIGDLSAITERLDKIIKYSNFEEFDTPEAFQSSKPYVSRYEYEMYLLLKFLVILSACQVGGILILIFVWRSRNGNS